MREMEGGGGTDRKRGKQGAMMLPECLYYKAKVPEHGGQQHPPTAVKTQHKCFFRES